jgi:catalase
VKDEQIKDVMVSHFYLADKDYGTQLAKAVSADLQTVQKLSSTN